MNIITNHKLVTAEIQIAQSFFGFSDSYDHILSFTHVPREGDLMFIWGAFYYDTPTYSVPAGWTQLANVNISAGPATWLWYKIAGASESNSYNFLSVQPMQVRLFGLTFTSYNSATPYDVIVTNTSGSGTGAALTTGAYNPNAGSKVILFYCKQVSSEAVGFTVSITGSFTAIVGDPSCGIRYKDFTTAATGENNTITWSTVTGRNRCMILEILPKAA